MKSFDTEEEARTFLEEEKKNWNNPQNLFVRPPQKLERFDLSNYKD